MYFTYIIRCKDDSLYTGYTSNIVRRMNEHKLGINSK
ncbi:GIY-YIG nuclease family protein [Clostridioides difficile]|nr:GIY-YIG nuclease family protein [Clostridioides difficile]